jgi:hypothetical protein
MFLLFLGAMHNGKDFCPPGSCAGLALTFRSRNLQCHFLQMCFNAFDEEADLDVLDHPVLNLFYYLVCMKFAKHEIGPVWFVANCATLYLRLVV